MADTTAEVTGAQKAGIMKFGTFLRTASFAAALTFSSAISASSEEAWNGPYWGGKITYSFGEKDIVGDRFTYNQNSNPVLVNHDYDGLGFFGFVGQNWRDGNIVYGVEAALGYLNAESDLVFNPDNDYDQIDFGITGELTGRLGAIVGNSMVYIKGGVTGSRIRNTGGDMQAAGPDINDRYFDESFQYSPMGGVGVEHDAGNGIILRLEGTIADFGSFAQTNNQNQTYRVSNGQVVSTSFGIVIPF